MNKLTLPKSCCSCQHYTPIGFKDDEHCPHTYKNGIGKETGRKTRTRYGRCSKTKTEVFMTELCPNYKQEPYINVVDVTNRPAPMNPHQVSLDLGAA